MEVTGERRLLMLSRSHELGYDTNGQYVVWVSRCR